MSERGAPAGADERRWSGTDLNLLDYLAILKRQRLLILLTVLVAVLVTAGLTYLEEPVYESSSRVLVRTSTNQQLFPVVGNANNLVRSVDAELEYASGDAFRDAARSASPPGVSVTVEQVGGDSRGGNNSGLIRFEARGTDPDAVAAAANAWAETYVTTRHELERSEVEAAIVRDEALLGDLEEQRDEILAPLEPLDDAIAEAQTDPQLLSVLLAQRSTLQQSLNATLAPIEQQINQLNTSLASLRLTATYLEDPEVSARVASDANVPTDPVEPSWTRNILLAVVVGGVLGVGFGLLREGVSDRIDGASAMERAVRAPVLGEIPTYDADREPFPTPGSAVLERYRDIATSLELLTSESEASDVILVTSALEEVGKTTLVANMARQLATEGRTVLVISGDLRRPSIEEIFEIPSSPGLVDVLAGSTDIFGVLQLIDDDLYVVPSGKPVADPGLLLRVQSIQALRDQIDIASKFDVVLVDAPPVLAVADPLRLAGMADGVIIVARAGLSRRRDVSEAANRLLQVDANVVGAVVTGTKSTRSSYSY